MKHDFLRHSVGASIVAGLASLAGLVPSAQAQCTDPVWVQIFPETAPSPRYSPASSQGGSDAFGNTTAIFFGGQNASGVLPDLWQWTGSNWVRRVENAGTLARGNAAARTQNIGFPPGSVLFHGGVDSNFTARNEILLWQNNQLSNLVFSIRQGPGARFNHAWASDPSSNDNLMSGGGTCAGLNNEAWWVSNSVTFPIANPEFGPIDNRRWLHSIIFDSNRNRFWSLGGSTVACNGVAADGRSFGRAGGSANGTWTNFPNLVNPNRSAAGVAYNPERDQLIVFGGETVSFPSAQGLRGDTWLTPDGGQTWRQVAGPAPSPRRAFNALQYVPAENHFVLFGGHDGNYLGDTWVLTYKPVFVRQPRDVVICPGTPSVTIPVDAAGREFFGGLQGINPLNGLWEPLFGNLVQDNQVVGQLSVAPFGRSVTFTPTASGPRTLGPFRLVASGDTCAGVSVSNTFTITIADVCCDSIDFNNDGGNFDPTDIEAFLSVFSEGPCIPANATCNDIDFNNDGGIFDPCDIQAFLTVFSEGPCTPCGN